MPPVGAGSAGTNMRSMIATAKVFSPKTFSRPPIVFGSSLRSHASSSSLNSRSAFIPAPVLVDPPCRTYPDPRSLHCGPYCEEWVAPMIVGRAAARHRRRIPAGAPEVLLHDLQVGIVVGYEPSPDRLRRKQPVRERAHEEAARSHDACDVTEDLDRAREVV